MNSLMKRLALVAGILSATSGIQAENRLSEVLPKMPVGGLEFLSYSQTPVITAALGVALISAGLSLGGFANLICCTKPNNANRTRTPYTFEENPLVCFIAGAISTWGCLTLASIKFKELAEAINSAYVDAPGFALGVQKNLGAVLAKASQEANTALEAVAAAKIISSSSSIPATPVATVSGEAAFRFTPPASATAQVSGLELRINK